MDAEIKKCLYKENTLAHFKYIRKGKAYYRAEVASIAVELYFAIPFEDMGEATFYPEQAAKHLIRWYIENN